MPDKNAVFCSAVRISLRLYVACGTLSLLVLEKAGQHKYSNHQRGLLLNQLYHLMQMNKWKTFLENLGCYFFRNCFTPLCRGQHNNKTAVGLISAFTPNFRAADARLHSAYKGFNKSQKIFFFSIYYLMELPTGLIFQFAHFVASILV